MKIRTTLPRDIQTVFWKEKRELLMNVTGSRGRLSILVFLGVFGVLMPLQTGRDWIETSVAVISWAWLPVLLVSGVIADSIAGERERHTLETLLATRLPDPAIYLGKVFVAVLYGCVQVWLIALVSACTVNLAYWNGRVSFYSLTLSLAIVVYPVFTGALTAGVAALLAIGAETSRQAHQVMSIVSIVLLLPVFLINLIPQPAREALIDRLGNADWPFLALAIPAAILVLALVMLYAGYRKFTRIELLKKGG